MSAVDVDELEETRRRLRAAEGALERLRAAMARAESYRPPHTELSMGDIRTAIDLDAAERAAGHVHAPLVGPALTGEATVVMSAKRAHELEAIVRDLATAGMRWRANDGRVRCFLCGFELDDDDRGHPEECTWRRAVEAMRP